LFLPPENGHEMRRAPVPPYNYVLPSTPLLPSIPRPPAGNASPSPAPCSPPLSHPPKTRSFISRERLSRSGLVTSVTGMISPSALLTSSTFSCCRLHHYTS